MSSLTELYRGRVQAQGDDIKKPKGGYSHSWAQQKPVTDQEGLSFLDKIEEQCTKSQKEKREQCFRRARLFVKTASKQGGVGPDIQPRSYCNTKCKVPNARVDIEIHSGLTFVPATQEK